MRAIDADKLKEVLERNFGHTGGASVLTQLIDAQDTVQPETNWIPVTERLPDNSRNVLITHKGGVSMGWYNGLYFEKGASTHHRKIKTVTAWAEKPEPYKGVME